MRKGIQVNIQVYTDDPDEKNAFLETGAVLDMLIDAVEAHGLVMGGTATEVDLDVVDEP